MIFVPFVITIEQVLLLVLTSCQMIAIHKLMETWILNETSICLVNN